MAKPILTYPVLPAILDHFLQTRLHTPGIIGMDVAYSEFDPLFHGDTIVTERVLKAVAPQNPTARQIPIPQHIIGSTGDQAELLFMGSEYLLRLLADRDIADGSDHTRALCGGQRTQIHVYADFAPVFPPSDKLACHAHWPVGLGLFEVLGYQHFQ